MMTIREMLVTDLTRMGGTRVCVAGYVGNSWEALTCVRPVVPFYGIEEAFLFKGAAPIIRPFAVVKLKFGEREASSPPHTEDWLIDRTYREFCRMLDEDGRRRFLARTATPAISELFGCPILDGAYVMQGTGVQSLGTVRAAALESVRFARREEGEDSRYEYRMQFSDEAGGAHNLPVTDLAFRRFCAQQCVEWDIDCAEWSNRLTHTLAQADDLFLRIGLARQWSKHPDRCYLQVTGVYSFPDYLGSRCFADFPPAPR
jgi:hypothetical protein